MTQETQTGTLEELNVHIGDVVKSVEGAEGSESYFLKFIGLEWEVRSNDVWCAEINDSFIIDCEHIFTVVSRAAPADDTPPTRGEMTDDEAEDIAYEIRNHMELDQNHEAGLIPISTRILLTKIADAIKPEPLVETVTLYGSYNGGQWVFSPFNDGIHSVVQTFTTANGEPDLDSIKMERINE